MLIQAVFPRAKCGFTSGRRKLYFPTNFSVQVSRHGVQLLLHLSLHPEWGLALPPHPPLPGFIVQLQKSRIDYSPCLPLTPIPADNSCLEELTYISTHLSESAGCNYRNAQFNPNLTVLFTEKTPSAITKKTQKVKAELLRNTISCCL